MKKSENPTLSQLRLLLVVYRAQSLGAAARELAISQPVLSRAAREFERRCGFELFDRGLNRTYLTRNGTSVATQARRVLDEYERLMDMIAKIAQREARSARKSADSEPRPAVVVAIASET